LWALPLAGVTCNYFCGIGVDAGDGVDAGGRRRWRGCGFGVGMVLAMVCGGQYPLVVMPAVILVRKKEKKK
jgi:hypothetical protein